MPDRIEILREAAQARHDATLRRAEATLRTVVRHDARITFRGFADAARVSRSWLYRQPHLREQIEQLRQQRPPTGPLVPPAERATTDSLREQIEQLRQQRPSTGPALPPAERATADSLRQQIHAYREEIARLTKENQALYEQLAHRLGAARAAAVTAPF
jgi:hypothetical protein